MSLQLPNPATWLNTVVSSQAVSQWHLSATLLNVSNGHRLQLHCLSKHAHQTKINETKSSEQLLIVHSGPMNSAISQISSHLVTNIAPPTARYDTKWDNICMGRAKICKSATSHTSSSQLMKLKYYSEYYSQSHDNKLFSSKIIRSISPKCNQFTAPHSNE